MAWCWQPDNKVLLQMREAGVAMAPLPCAGAALSTRGLDLRS